MKTYNIGLIGIGDISRVYINNLKRYPFVKLLACASRSLEKAQKKADEHGIPKAYSSYDELLADPEIDIILNLTLPEVHGEITKAALLAGKHVYSEKPLAATFEEGKELVALANEKKLFLGCAPDTFLGSRIQECKDIIDSGKIGDIVAASAFVVSHGHEWHHPNPAFFYQPGAGPILDIVPYYLSAILALIGPIDSCASYSKRSFDTRTVETLPLKGETIPVTVDTHFSTTMHLKNGAILTLIASFDVWDSELPRIEIYGTKGTICIRDVDPVAGPNLFGGDILLKTQEEYRWQEFPRPEKLIPWQVIKSKRPFNSVVHSKNSRGIGLIDMILAIEEEREPRASKEMSLHSLEVMEKIITSAEEHSYKYMETTFTVPPLLPDDFPLGTDE